MKNAFRFLFSTLLVFLFFSCAQINGDNSGSVSISTESIVKSVARANGSDSCTIVANVSGGYQKEISKTVSISDVNSSRCNFVISGLPVGRKINIDVSVKDSDNKVIYAGGKNDVILKRGVNNIVIPLNYPGWYVLWNKYDKNSADFNFISDARFSIYKNMPDGSEDLTDGIYNSNRLLIDFCFDEYQNLYTIEADADFNADMSSWACKSYFINKYEYGLSDIHPKKIYEITPNGLSKYKAICFDSGYVYVLFEKETKSYLCRMTSGGRDLSFGESDGNIELGKDGISSIELRDGFVYYVRDNDIYKSSLTDNTNIKLSSLGVDYNGVSDILVIDNFLYILGPDISNPYGDAGDPRDGGYLLKLDINTQNTEELFSMPGQNRKENPTSADNYLYGPVKFIAIKPKKLVIADDGYFDYGDYSTPSKNIDGVVTVNLADEKKIASRVLLSNVTFTGFKGCNFKN